MKVNAINLIRQGAEIARHAGDGMRAYSLHELANNLLLVMQGKESLEEFMRVYVCNGSERIDLDAAFPPPPLKEAAMPTHRPPFRLRRILAAYGLGIVAALVFLFAAIEGGLIR